MSNISNAVNLIKKNLNSRVEACDALWIREPEEYKGRFTAETAAAILKICMLPWFVWQEVENK